MINSHLQDNQSLDQINALDAGLKSLAFPQQGDQLKPTAFGSDPGHILHHFFLLAVILDIYSG